MAKQELVLYLSLTPEFGGTRFGPFEGFEVRLGSTQGSNDITLPGTLGVAGHHVKVMQQSGMGLILAPVDRTAPVYVWKDGAHRPQQIAAPVAVRSGDSFALVTADGPRFVVEMAPLPPEVIAEREAAKAPWNRKRPGLKAFKDEGKRQVWVSILTTGPGQVAMRIWTFFRTGEFLRPRNLFAMIGVMGGYIAAAGAFINNFSLGDQLEEKEQDLYDCQQAVGLSEGGGESIASFTYDRLAASITGLDGLQKDLDNDPNLLAEVEAQAGSLYRLAQSQYGWLIDDPRLNGRRVKQFIGLRESLGEDAGDLTPELAHLLPYASLTPESTRTLWATFEGSGGDSVCAHGHMALTWRQAHQFGIEPNLDYFIQGDPDTYEQSGSGEARAALEQTAKAISYDAEAELSAGDFKTKVETLNAQNHCLTLDSEDTRSRLGTVKRAMIKHLGEDATWVAEPGDPGAITGRLAKLYLGDVYDTDFSDRSQYPTLEEAVADTLKEKGGEGEWALKQTARTIARSMVLPCQAVLADKTAATAVFGERLPDPLDCLVLEWKLRNGQ